MNLVSKVNNERINKWKEDKEKIYINSSDIKITEPVHLKVYEIDFYSVITKHQNKEKIDRSIIVKQTDDGKYTLVMGIKWLTIAKLLNIPIACIVADKDVTYAKIRQTMGLLGYNFNIPKDTENVIPIWKILVPRCFIKSEPTPFKMEMCRDYFIKKGRLDKSVTVVPSKKREGFFILKDEYIRYLLLIELGIKNIPIKILKEEVEKNEQTKI